MNLPKEWYIYDFDIIIWLYIVYKINHNDMFLKPLQPRYNKNKYNCTLKNYIIPIWSIAHEKSTLVWKLSPQYKRLFGKYVSSLDSK